REYTFAGIEGSNPSGSAIAPDQLAGLGRLFFKAVTMGLKAQLIQLGWFL
ncbi:MAG: hypothetical protein ACJAQT_004139, partial [Akkermansiaceae bacterium]